MSNIKAFSLKGDPDAAMTDERFYGVLPFKQKQLFSICLLSLMIKN